MDLTKRNPVRIFKALSEETRLQMLILILQHQELCVCDLESVLEIGQSKASRHLRYLLNAGLLQDRREGVWIYYRIANNLNPIHQTILASISQLIEPALLADLNRRLTDWRETKKCGVARDKPSNKSITQESIA